MRFAPQKRLAPAAVLDGLTTAVIGCDPQLQVIWLNTAAENLFAVSRSQALGAPLAAGVPQLADCCGRLQHAQREAAGFIERELRLTRGDNELKIDLTVTPIALGGGTGLLLEALALERTLRISRDDLLIAQHQASRELIRGLAHEINNPLGGIRGAAQLLERAFPDSEHREYTRVIIREADRLQNLVGRMLGPTRAPSMARLNIHEVVEHVRKLIEAEAPPGVHVGRDYDPSIPELEADREQLIQALLNLARNALQAVGAAGEILLRTRTRRQITLAGRRHRLVLQVDVQDDGAGIDPLMLEKVFYPLVTTRADGSGLGLPIAQYLVHAHGGLIECRSRPGCTVFSILLPPQAAA
ncbi:MAG: PAS domain-containing protein [Gammaproteobacteria bacterium]|nr:PAS domain-containing protein [Gammaproteobacteria bacterium]